MKILIVNGAPRSGKDLFCNYAFINRPMIYAFSTVDRVKQVALFAGWSGEKDDKGRKFLSDLKDAMTEYNDIPYEYTIEAIKEEIRKLEQQSEHGAKDAIFIVQSREPKDIQRWVEQHDAKTLFIYREGLNQTWNNHADSEVANYDYDYYLNNGLDKSYWETRTVEFIDQIRKEKWESHI